MDRREDIEMHLAHLTKMVEELNEVVTIQASEIDRLKSQVQLLIDREVARASEGTGGVILGDERPPHY